MTPDPYGYIPRPYVYFTAWNGEEWPEGVFTPLFREGQNVKYSHHPIAAAVLLRPDPSLRHIETADLVAALAEYGHRRWNVWDELTSRCINPTETRFSVVARLGACCVGCNQMAWKPQEGGDIWDNIEDLKDKVRAQHPFAYRLNRLWTHPIPVFCDDCMGVAKQSIKHGWWRYDEIDALSGLVAVYEHRHNIAACAAA